MTFAKDSVGAVTCQGGGLQIEACAYLNRVRECRE
jgi:hypothetical protein